MEMSGERRIPAPRDHVWAKLNDPDVLRDCIPGCQKLEGNLEDGLAATVTAKIGPVKATFQGKVVFSEVVPPESYVISGEGKGGVAGFAKGGARVFLKDEGAETLLSYSVQAQVGGKLAQLGGRLIDSTAKSMADQFFNCFSEKAALPVAEDSQVEATTEAPQPAPVPVAAPTPVAANEPAGTEQPAAGNSSSLALIIGGAVVAAVALYLLFA